MISHTRLGFSCSIVDPAGGELAAHTQPASALGPPSPGPAGPDHREARAQLQTHPAGWSGRQTGGGSAGGALGGWGLWGRPSPMAPVPQSSTLTGV